MTALLVTVTTTDLSGWLILGVLTVIVTAALLCAWDLAVGWLQRRRAEAAELDLYLRRQRTHGMGDVRVEITADAGPFMRGMSRAEADVRALRDRLEGEDR